MYELRSFCFNFNNDDKNDEIWLEEGRDNYGHSSICVWKGIIVRSSKWLNI